MGKLTLKERTVLVLKGVAGGKKASAGEAEALVSRKKGSVEQRQLTGVGAAMLADLFQSVEPEANVCTNMHAPGVHANSHGLALGVMSELRAGLVQHPYIR